MDPPARPAPKQGAKPAAPKKPVPTAATIRQRAANAAKPPGPDTPPKQGPTLTPEELKQREVKEQALIAKGNEWKKDPKLTDEERDLGLYSINRKESQAVNRDSKDVAVRDVVQLCKKKTGEQAVYSPMRTRR